MPFDATPIEYPTDPVLDTLVKVRELLPDHWTQGSTAKNAQLWAVDTFAAEAVRYCLGGAILRTLGDKLADLESPSVKPILLYLDFADSGNLVRWNDSAKREEVTVLKRLDKAIKKRRADLLEHANAV